MSITRAMTATCTDASAAAAAGTWHGWREVTSISHWLSHGTSAAAWNRRPCWPTTVTACRPVVLSQHHRQQPGHATPLLLPQPKAGLKCSIISWIYTSYFTADIDVFVFPIPQSSPMYCWHNAVGCSLYVHVCLKWLLRPPGQTEAVHDWRHRTTSQLQLWHPVVSI